MKEYLGLLNNLIVIIPTLGSLINGFFLNGIPVDNLLLARCTILSVLLSLFSIFAIFAYYKTEMNPNKSKRMIHWAIFWALIGLIDLAVYIFCIEYFDANPIGRIEWRIIFDFSLVLAYSFFFVSFSVAFTILALRLRLEMPKANIQ